MGLIRDCIGGLLRPPRQPDQNSCFLSTNLAEENALHLGEKVLAGYSLRLRNPTHLHLHQNRSIGKGVWHDHGDSNTAKVIQTCRGDKVEVRVSVQVTREMKVSSSRPWKNFSKAKSACRTLLVFANVKKQAGIFSYRKLGTGSSDCVRNTSLQSETETYGTKLRSSAYEIPSPS